VIPSIFFEAKGPVFAREDIDAMILGLVIVGCDHLIRHDGAYETSSDPVERPAAAAFSANGAHRTLGAAFAGHVEPRTARTRCQTAALADP
jgi:hypothetical protein